MIFRAMEHAYSLASAETGIEFYVDRLRRERHELIGELSVSAGMLSSSRAIDGVLSAGSFNLSNPRARAERANLLGERARTNGKIDWHGMLEEVCQRILTAERTGQPSIVLRDVPRPAADLHHVLDGFQVPQQHGTILFGDGGTAKSYFALYLLGSLASVGWRVALFDWELDAAQHRLRLERLFGEMPDVRYVRCDRPLVYEADRLQKIAKTDKLDYLVYDSAGYACSGKPEDAEQALAYFRAVRQIGVGSLHIAHISKGDNAEHKPFGSSFWHNSARSTWFVKPAADGPVLSGVTTIGLFNRKANLGPLQPALGFDVTFTDTTTQFTRVNVADVDDLASALPLWQRMKAALRTGPLTLASL